MALAGIFASVSGLQAAFHRVRQSSHNLANVSTPAFRPGRVNQVDTANQAGTRVAGVTLGSAGPIIPDGSPLHLAIDGGGMFVLNDGQGGQLYTRAGSFSLNENGEVVDALGRTTVPPVQVPREASQVHISAGGQVTALDPNGVVLAQGQLQTAVFGNPFGLRPVGGNAYQATDSSGPPVNAAPGTPGHGQIVSGALQASGTDVAVEMVGMITSERAAEANAKAIQTQDEMLGVVLNLKG